MLKSRIIEPISGYQGIQDVMAQVGYDGHQFQLGLRRFDLECGFIQSDIQRHCRAVFALCQGVVLHYRVGQHGDFVTRHVDGGQPLTAHFINVAAGFNRKTWCCNVNADDHRPRAQALYRQRIVNFRGG